MHLPERALEAIILCSLQLAACQPVVQQTQPAATEQRAEPIEPQTTQTTPEPEADNFIGWWNEVAFHQFFARLFKDSADDGIGGFKGMITKSDCLGVSGALSWFLSTPPLENRHSMIFVLNK